MSINNILKAGFTIILGGVVGYTGVQYFTSAEETNKNRFLASIPISKLGQEQMAKSLFEVKLNLDSIASKENETSTLLIQVIALKKIQSGLRYNWTLPQGVTLVSGSLQDQLGEITAGNSAEISIQVSGFSKELKKYISFEIAGQQNQIPVRQEVLVSSRIEDSLEYMIQQAEKSKQDDSINGKVKDLKKSKFSQENVVR